MNPLLPSYKLSPGPGRCKNINHLDNSQATISSQGKYTLSHLSNCSVPKFIQTKNYDQTYYRKTPGPGAYNQ